MVPKSAQKKAVAASVKPKGKLSRRGKKSVESWKIYIYKVRPYLSSASVFYPAVATRVAHLFCSNYSNVGIRVYGYTCRLSFTVLAECFHKSNSLHFALLKLPACWPHRKNAEGSGQILNSNYADMCIFIGVRVHCTQTQ